MNILPKKRWHVRTRDNINRVRRDEAKAAEAERETERRIKLAEQEARTNLLRERARIRNPQSQQFVDEESKSQRHVNLFENLEAGETTANVSKENEAEKKKEREEWEKKVGILTYLGQDSQELSGKLPWWQCIQRNKEEPDSKSESKKDVLDPLNDVRKYLGCEGVQKYMKGSSKRKRTSSSSSSSSKVKKKHKERKSEKSDNCSRKKKKKKEGSRKKKKSKKHKYYSSDNSDDDQQRKEAKRKRLEKLRMERLERERKERIRETKVLNGQDPDVTEEKETEKKEGVSRKYNSQFNPEIARQNKLDPNKKYWLD